MKNLRGDQKKASGLSEKVSPFQTICTEYTSLLLSRDRTQASQLITKAAQSGMDIRDIYLHIFQPALQEVGRLWQTNEISIAQEHYFTAATQMIMSQLFPYILNAKRNGLRIVIASVEEEWHEIGARMVSDFLEMDGWETYYLGANMPAQSIKRAMQEFNPHLVALSATISEHIPLLKDIVDQVRAIDPVGNIKVLVGGYPFNLEPDLWKMVGADGFAKNAIDAVKTAKQLVTRQ